MTMFGNTLEEVSEAIPEKWQVIHTWNPSEYDNEVCKRIPLWISVPLHVLAQY